MNISEAPRPKVLVLTFTPIHSEPRALKQIQHLSQRYDVTSAGFGPQAVAGVPHIELDPSPPTRNPARFPLVKAFSFLLRLYPYLSRHDPRVAGARERLAQQKWDIIIAHDVATVPLSRSLNPHIGVLVDLHEYAPRQDEHSRIFKMLIAPYYRWILRKHVAKCPQVTTVGKGILEEYRREFGIASTLVVNATPFHTLEPTDTSAPIRLVHSGISAAHRKLEVMIDAVTQSNANVTLDLFLMPTDEAYMSFLRARAGNDARIRFRDPVPYSELIDTLHSYDVGLTLIAPTTFNLAWCLPNKFFDFVQARLGVISGPSPEMASFIERYGFGVVTDDFSADSLRRVLDSLTPGQVRQLKQASHTHAEELSGEHQSRIWGDIVDRMVLTHSRKSNT